MYVVHPGISEDSERGESFELWRKVNCYLLQVQVLRGRPVGFSVKMPAGIPLSQVIDETAGEAYNLVYVKIARESCMREGGVQVQEGQTNLS